MPVEKEVLLKRIEYLRDVQRSLEHGIEIAIIYGFAAPILNSLFRMTMLFLGISIVAAIVIAILLAAIAIIQRELRYLWREVMKDPRWWEKIPWIGIVGLIICLSSIVLILLTS